MFDPHVAAIQKALAALGFDPGPADGDYGARTRMASDAWQAAGGAPASRPLATTTPHVPGAFIRQGSAGHPVREIVVHCSDTRPEWMGGQPLSLQVAEIRRWHTQDRGWKDIGYHWVIGRLGGLVSGRKENVIGAGVEGHNAGVIHICLIGGHGGAGTDPFERHFTPAQAATLLDQIYAIGLRTQIERVSGHNEWAAKACPCFRVPTWRAAA